MPAKSFATVAKTRVFPRPVGLRACKKTTVCNGYFLTGSKRPVLALFALIFASILLFVPEVFGSQKSRESDKSAENCFVARKVSGDVFYLSPSGEMIKVSKGDSIPLKAHLTTGSKGQIAAVSNGTELRMKEDSTLILKSQTIFHLVKGSAGLKSERGTEISSRHYRAKGKGILVMKCFRVLTRFAVVKGSAVVTGPWEEKMLINASEEISGTDQIGSLPYLVNDDLYFMWYW